MIDDMLRPTGSVLQRFTRDLTAEARAGRLDPIRCRAEEISRVIDILLRHGKNNPALVGPSGVGKTAIVEGLAQRVAVGKVPLSLRGIRVLAVDHVSLLAGTTFRGQYEARIEGLVAEATAAPDVVLFIDELHNLIGQGTAMGAAMDAANMLKPALVRGDFRVIGATTDDEYDRWVCGDPALERRFQKVTVRELSAEETLEILNARVLRLERHHNVVIAPEAVQASLRLTDLFVTDRMRPDRAIDALDEACAHAHAVAAYSADAERLILERRALLRDARAAAEQGRRERHPDRMTDEAPAPADDAGAEPDPIELFARDGFAAIERFGAELEEMFGMRTAAPERAAEAPPAAAAAEVPPAAVPEPAVAEPAARPAERLPRLAALDAELARRLTAEGVVVRGHDVARVVGLSSGKNVAWAE
jgi:ATP-dependent Clp protease ATP-binding subunit ClpA